MTSKHAGSSPSVEADRAAAARLAGIAEIVNRDDVLVRRGRFLDADIHVGVGGLAFIMPVRQGRIGAIEPATALMRPWTFSVRAAAEDWQGHWQEFAAPGWYDILAMKKHGRMTIEGDLKPLLQNLQYVKDVLAAPRRALQVK